MSDTKVLFQLVCPIGRPFEELCWGELRGRFAQMMDETVPRIYSYKLDQDDVILERYVELVDTHGAPREVFRVPFVFTGGRDGLLDAICDSRGSLAGEVVEVVALVLEVHREVTPYNPAGQGGDASR